MILFNFRLRLRLILSLILIQISMIPTINSFCYSTSFQIVSKRNLCDTVGNFMNLNKILNDYDNYNKNNYKNKYRINDHYYDDYKIINNNLKIVKYNNNKSLSFRYTSYSNLDDYKYENKYLLIDKNNYYATFKFKIDDIKFNYIFKITNDNNNNNNQNQNQNNKRTKWNISIKYTTNYISYVSNMNRIIYRMIFSCINKKPLEPNGLLLNYFN